MTLSLCIALATLFNPKRPFPNSAISWICLFDQLLLFEINRSARRIVKKHFAARKM